MEELEAVGAAVGAAVGGTLQQMDVVKSRFVPTTAVPVEPPNRPFTCAPLSAPITTALLDPFVADVSTMLPFTAVAVAPVIAELRAVAQAPAVAQTAVNLDVLAAFWSTDTTNFSEAGGPIATVLCVPATIVVAPKSARALVPLHGKIATELLLPAVLEVITSCVLEAVTVAPLMAVLRAVAQAEALMQFVEIEMVWEAPSTTTIRSSFAERKSNAVMADPVREIGRAHV